MNLLLFTILLDEKKFHLRIYFLLSISSNGSPKCIICNKNNEMEI
jgi:hypothetical protein